MTFQEYQELLKEKEKIDKAIFEYENDCTRGCLRVIENKMGYKHSEDGFAIQLEYRISAGDRYGHGKAYWKTIFNSVNLEDIISLLKSLSESAPEVYKAFLSKNENNN